VTDRLVRITTALAVAAVAVVAAIISYQHACELVRSHGESGTTARLLPFTVDGLIWAASMVVLAASRPGPARTTARRLEPGRWICGYGRCQPGAWRRARPRRRTGQRMTRLGAGRHIRAATRVARPAASAERGVDSGHFAAHSDLAQLRHLASGRHSS
jgi:Protein of unknown function (DUF2637)